MDKDIALFSQVQWVKILVKSEGRDLLGSVQVVVGMSCYAIQL